MSLLLPNALIIILNTFFICPKYFNFKFFPLQRPNRLVLMKMDVKLSDIKDIKIYRLVKCLAFNMFAKRFFAIILAFYNVI